jgi:hypothetical protein
MRKKTHNLLYTGISYRALPVKTPRLPTVSSCSELLSPHTPPRTPVLAFDSPAAHQKGRTVVEVASDSDDDRPTSKVKSVHQSPHRST